MTFVSISPALMLSIFVWKVAWHIASFSIAQVQIISVKYIQFYVNNIA